MGTRTLEELRHHYLIERELANRLRQAPPAERPGLYTALYDELFRRVPTHPMLSQHRDDDTVRPETRAHFRWLKPYLSAEVDYLEIGPGDCAFALRVAEFVRTATGVEISEELTKRVNHQQNFKLVLGDGVHLPLPDQSVDLAFSNQLIEHLHPDDAISQLHELYRILRPGGRLFCITPNRLCGPHDISKYFSDQPEGFHLREYSFSELQLCLLDIGYAQITPFAFLKGQPRGLSAILARSLEHVISRVPSTQRRFLATRRPIFNLLGVNLVAVKPS